MKTRLVFESIVGAVRTENGETAWRFSAIKALLNNMRPSLSHRERKVLDKILAQMDSWPFYSR